ncbi:MAG: BLUF domain-containing protein [Spirochaeta sp.]|nr:BLUF domain-containing protein [Spirochaeta sp.]
MKFVIYRSKATEEMRASDVGDILLTSRMNNQKRGITGALLYRNGFFLQVLEGQDDVVDDLVRRIRKDGRHTAFTVLYSGETSKLVFPSWSMARVPEDAVTRSPAVFQALESDQIDENTARQFLAEVSAVVR